MMSRFAHLVVISALLTACTTTQAAEQFPQVPSYAISQKTKTTLGKALAPEVASHKNMSGFRVLSTGSESFVLRLALIQAAEKTLDLQYYSMHDDTTANLLLEAVVLAAQRGVRVRFLIDNISMDEVDKTLSVLDGLKNVEVRVFNPSVTRDDGLMGYVLKYTTDIYSIERRMHNKMLVADNQMAIMGGRNLGDEYFEENTDMAFRDIDILTAGPITSKLSASFDNYWNHKQAVPIGQLRKPDAHPEATKKLRAQLADQWSEVEHTEKGRKLLHSKLHERLRDADVRLIWAPASLEADSPHKVDVSSEEAVSKPMNRLDRLLVNAKKEFIAVSPYFVPQDEGVAWLKGIVDRGIGVKVLTNSLASTDVVAVHTGYSPYREALMKAGIELYEMKPKEGKRPPQRLIGSSAPAHASLHAKVYVVDAKDVMIGSFNLDPRSIEINTEIALVIHSKEIAAQIIKIFNEVTSPEDSYQLVLAEDGGLIWKTKEKGEPKEYRHDPKAGIWRNVEAGVIGLLPIEDHL